MAYITRICLTIVNGNYQFFPGLNFVKVSNINRARQQILMISINRTTFYTNAAWCSTWMSGALSYCFDFQTLSVKHTIEQSVCKSITNIYCDFYSKIMRGFIPNPFLLLCQENITKKLLFSWVRKFFRPSNFVWHSLSSSFSIKINRLMIFRISEDRRQRPKQFQVRPLATTGI